MAEARSKSAWLLAVVAFAVGALFAAVSVYWGLGGTWLIDTVSGNLARTAPHGVTAVAATWGAAVVKLIAAVLPVLAVRMSPAGRWCRLVRVLTWTEAIVLTLYGGVLTLVGWLVQAGAIDTSADADRRALRWHAYLWDPWFLVWGLLVLTSLLMLRREARRPT